MSLIPGFATVSPSRHAATLSPSQYRARTTANRHTATMRVVVNPTPSAETFDIALKQGGKLKLKQGGYLKQKGT